MIFLNLKVGDVENESTKLSSYSVKRLFYMHARVTMNNV